VLARLIENIFKSSLKGYRYITYQLKRLHGIVINRKTVLRYMRILGIKSPIRRKRFISTTQYDTNKKARIVHHNVLAQNFKASRPLEKLVTDVSYLYHREGRLYISVIKDLYDNSILAYTLSKFNNNELVFRNLDLVFDDTWDNSKACILHSDQGFQYTNVHYIKKLESFGVTVSHSRKANVYDNACCENFFSHLKSESLELNIPKNEHTLINQVEQYINWYNTDRPQEKLKGMTPFEFRLSYLP
jgi:transposase InsO family protein